MKKKVLYLVCIALLFSCGKSPVYTDDYDPLEGASTLSVNGLLEYKGLVSMQDGPHDLLIEENNLYAVRDHRVFKFDISTPIRPVLQKEYALGSAARFGKLSSVDGKIYVPCKTDGHLYEFDTDLTLSKKYALNGINLFRPNKMVKDENKVYWIGGSDGSEGVLAKYELTEGSLTLADHIKLGYNSSNIEGMVTHGAYVFVTIATGDLIAFHRGNPLGSEGNIFEVVYEHEAGTQAWGHEMIVQGNIAYWANGGAGLASANVWDPRNMSLGNVLTNSAFKSQFPDSDGITAYDVAYNEKWRTLCIANGWGGVLLTKTDAMGQVVDYIDLKDFNFQSVATKDDYIYAGNIATGAGTNGNYNTKGIVVFKRVK